MFYYKLKNIFFIFFSTTKYDIKVLQTTGNFDFKFFNPKISKNKKRSGVLGDPQRNNFKKSVNKLEKI